MNIRPQLEGAVGAVESAFSHAKVASDIGKIANTVADGKPKPPGTGLTPRPDGDGPNPDPYSGGGPEWLGEYTVYPDPQKEITYPEGSNTKALNSPPIRQLGIGEPTDNINDLQYKDTGYKGRRTVSPPETYLERMEFRNKTPSPYSSITYDPSVKADISLQNEILNKINLENRLHERESWINNNGMFSYKDYLAEKYTEERHKQQEEEEKIWGTIHDYD